MNIDALLDERQARIALTCVTEPGCPALSTHLRSEGPSGALAGLSHDQRAADRISALDLAQVLRLAEHDGIRFVAPGDDEWPSHGLPDDIPGLWVRGDGRIPDGEAVAVVGSRAATAYGENVATNFARGLAGLGWTVVSGGAYGIDACAHRGALMEGGPTVAVMAGGLADGDLYPQHHCNLFGQIAETGAMVSMLPPGEHPSRTRFLARNRLTAALSRGVVLVEAASRSGSLNTARQALAMGLPVLAVPGPVTSANSVGPHSLIRDGEASLVTCVADIVAALDQREPACL